MLRGCVGSLGDENQATSKHKPNFVFSMRWGWSFILGHGDGAAIAAAVWALLTTASCLLAKTKMNRSEGGEENLLPIPHVADKWH